MAEQVEESTMWDHMKWKIVQAKSDSKRNRGSEWEKKTFSY